MLSPPDENEENNHQSQYNQTHENQMIMEEDEGPPENPKYREYLELYLVVRKRVCNAKVLSFNGETKIYRPFKWMNDQLIRVRKERLKSQQTEQELKQAEEKEAEAEREADEEKQAAEEEEEEEEKEGLGEVEGESRVIRDENIPSNVYRLLGVGILSTFLPSAILGGHLIDTTPLIDSNELERSMNSLLPLRQKVLNIFHGFETSNSVSLQR